MNGRERKLNVNGIVNVCLIVNANQGEGWQVLDEGFLGAREGLRQPRQPAFELIAKDSKLVFHSKPYINDSNITLTTILVEHRVKSCGAFTNNPLESGVRPKACAGYCHRS